jgi:hypothetical protein
VPTDTCPVDDLRTLAAVIEIAAIILCG